MNLFPLYMNDVFDFPTGLVAAVLIGFGFGFVLERAGFGRASILAAQFYFSDNRVLKVMFSAIVTALLGTVVLSELGLLNMSLVTIPSTFLYPQIVGGLILGVGFIVSGYCPGTSVVAMASGKWDGFATIVGVGVGSLAFGFIYDLVAPFYTSGALGPVRLPDLLGVGPAWIALGVVVMAVGAFLGAEKLERAMAARRREQPPVSPAGMRRGVFAGFAAVSALMIAALFVPSRTPEAAPQPFARIDAISVARWVIERPESMYLVDLRGSDLCVEDRVPGALCLPEDDADAEFVADFPTTRRLVLYGAGDLDVLPPGAAAFDGDVFVMDGGYAAFMTQILETPQPPADPTQADLDAFALRSALHAHFSGTAIQSPPPAVQPKKLTRGAKKKGGGC